MYIMTSECFNDGSKESTKNRESSTTSSDSNLLDNMITDNPLIFRICCFCLMRSRHRVDIAKTRAKNGNSNYQNEKETEIVSETIEIIKESE
jgi:hypothetical protein